MSQEKGRDFPSADNIHYGMSSLGKRSTTQSGTSVSVERAPAPKNPVKASPSIKQKPASDRRTTPAASKAITASAKPSPSTRVSTTEDVKKSIGAPSKQASKAKSSIMTSAEKERLENLKKEKEMRRRLEEKMRREAKAKKVTFIRLLLKEAMIFLRNAAFGIILAAVIGGIIGFIYYRNITVYSSDAADRTYAFYGYIDPEDETERAELQRKAREEGKENVKVIFKKTHIVLNDVAYLPVSYLTKLFNLSTSGDNNVRTVSIIGSNKGRGAEDYAVFTNGSRTISVNGATHLLQNAPIFKNGDVYVPFEFFEDYVKGISFKSITKWGKTTIGVILENPTISFTGANNETVVTPNIKDYVTTPDASHTYSFDLTPYEQYINPQDPNKYLTLINLENRLEKDYEPDDLVDVLHTRSSRKVPERMRLDAEKALEAMLKAAAADGITDVSVTSGYRSYDYQNSLFTQRLNEKLASGKFASRAAAEAETAKFTMYPGASEHQSGLCVDMHNLPSAMQSFAETKAYTWLYQHCADFGFILRYPRNKEQVTGISFEPWHYRFVGRFHAQMIMDSGLCLEEYMEMLDKE